MRTLYEQVIHFSLIFAQLRGGKWANAFHIYIVYLHTFKQRKYQHSNSIVHEIKFGDEAVI